MHEESTGDRGDRTADAAETRIAGASASLTIGPIMGVIASRGDGGRRVYESTPKEGGSVARRLRDEVVELGAEESAEYARLVEWLEAVPA